jgi:hypothetical protein
VVLVGAELSLDDVAHPLTVGASVEAVVVFLKGATAEPPDADQVAQAMVALLAQPPPTAFDLTDLSRAEVNVECGTASSASIAPLPKQLVNPVTVEIEIRVLADRLGRDERWQGRSRGCQRQIEERDRQTLSVVRVAGG